MLGEYDLETSKRLKNRGIDLINTQNFDAEKINCTRKFDVILLFEIVEHLFDPMKLLLQLYDLTNDKGMIFCTTPNLASRHSISRLKKFETPYCFAFYNKLKVDIAHKREFTPNEIVRLMDASGFNLDYLTSFESFNYLRRMRLKNRFMNWLIQLEERSRSHFLEKRNLRGRTIFYVGIKDSRKVLVRFPEEFYSEYDE
jgi:2-polyprenyl-3-methyl-5-hydroxy-6-metoxy-1,4-benzoquinol methylase